MARDNLSEGERHKSLDGRERTAMFAILDRFLDETMLMDKSNRVSSADFAPR